MRKYELTSDTKVFLGRTLYRIRALISFGSVSEGDLGGYVEREESLSHDGDARVSGDARVYGDAERTPVVVSGLTYNVTITDRHIRIVRKLYTTDQWSAFSDDAIEAMDPGIALDFWRAHKASILALAEYHQSKIKEAA